MNRLSLGDRARQMARIRRLRLVDKREVDRMKVRMTAAESRAAAYKEEIDALLTERQVLTTTLERVRDERDALSFRMEGLEK